MSGEHSTIEGPAEPRTRTRARAVRRAVLAAVLLVTGIAAVAARDASPAAAAGAPHATLVRDLPNGSTPHARDGDVRAVAVVGNTGFIGGNFTSTTDADGTEFNRSYILAFDRQTGTIRRTWTPTLDNEVFAIVPAPDGQSIYVAGRFNTVNGVTSLKVARLSVADGSRLPFQHGVNAVVTAMALQGDRLIIGGVFDTVQGRTRRVAALNAQTGAVDDSFDVAFTGTHRGTGEGKIWGIEAAPDGRSVYITGSFSQVGGLPRNQAVKLDAGPGPVTVAGWSTNDFAGTCGSFTDYVRDVSVAPDNSYVVFASTGGKGSGTNGTCDAVMRYPTTDTANVPRDWIEYSGGDSYYAIEASGTAVYVGGHFRWTNNSFGSDDMDPGAVPREGLAALDPTNGLPLSWNPGRDRGRAVWQLLATPDGLFVASDTDRIAGGIYKGRIAFFPLAGGKSVPQPPGLQLPVTIEQYVPGMFVTPHRVHSRSYDGTTLSAPTAVVADASALSGVRAAFAIGDTLYTAHSNGTLQARSFDGTTLGTPRTIDLLGMSSFASDIQSITSAFYVDGRLYYTRGQSTLYMRYFSTESEVLGAQRFSVASNSGNVSYSQLRNAVVIGDHVYYSTTSGTLQRATWLPGGGIQPGTSVQVSGSNANGISWSSNPFWARQAEAPNQPPSVSADGSCTGMRCTFSATAADADGTVTDIAWNLGDGTVASGPSATHTFTSTGPKTVTVTVTDDDGATASDTVGVSPTDIAPVASFTVECGNGTCGVDGSGSSDVDGQVVGWSWTFGDGHTATGPAAVNTYDESGTYTIGLTVTDNRGLTHSTSQSVEVDVPDPGADRGFVAVGTRTTGNTAATHPVTVPSEVQAGDQLLLFASANATTSITAPAGWQLEADAPTTAGRTSVFSRTAQAGDAGSSVTITLGTLARADVVVAAYRGLDLDQVVAAGGTYTTPTAPAAAGDWVVSYWSDKSATNVSWTAPAGVTTRHSANGTGAGHMSELLADSGAAVAAGTTGGLTATPTAQSTNAQAVTVVLNPLGPPPNQPPTVTASGSCSLMTCSFSAVAGDSDGTVTSIGWSFGDGGTASGATANHTFTTAGSHTVTVTATDDDGATATDTVVVTAVPAPPAAEHVGVAARTVGTSATSHPVTVPAAVEAGDQLLLFATSNAPGSATLDAPAGWTRLADVSTSGSRTAVFARTATAGMAGSTVTVTVGVAAKADVVLAAYRGVEVSGASGTTGYTTPTRAAAAGDWAVSYWADKSSSTAGWTAPGGVTTRHSHAGSGAGHVAELLADSGAGVAAGTVGGLTATPTTPVANAAAVTVVLSPLA